jgi:hypothetical protein
MKKRLISIIVSLVVLITLVPLAAVSADSGGPLDNVVIAPVTANITAGHVQQFAAVARDSQNVTIPDAAFEWSVVNGGGTIDSNGLFTAGNITGTFISTVNVTATYNSIVKSAYATVIINAQVLDNVVLAPVAANVLVNAVQQFNAVARDSANVTIPGADFEWSVVNGGGTIDDSGLFTAGNITGTYTNTVNVTAAYEGVFKSVFATVTVTDKVLDHVIISPVAAGVTVNTTRQFTAIARDSQNVTIPDVTFEWAVVNGGGTIDGNGLFTAGNITGNYTNTVKVTAVQGVISVTAYATVTVVPAPLKPVKLPPGWDKGNKNGWDGRDTPPGWSQGEKNGWADNMPPGLAKDREGQGDKTPPGLAKGKKEK